MKRSTLRRGVLIIALISSLWADVDGARAAEELVVYSGRKEVAVKPIVVAFQKKTGIPVKLKTGTTTGLAHELIQEKARPRADVFIATEVGVMEIIAKNGVLDKYVSPEAKGKDVPRSVFPLTDAKWKGKIAIAGTQERTTLSWVSSLMVAKGADFTKQYLKQLYANGLKILPDNADVWQGVGRGEFAIGLTNSPNYFLARKAGYPVGVVYPDQKDGEVGTLLNLNAIALVKGAQHLGAAKRFIDFVLSAAGQRILIDGAYEIPLRPDIIDLVPLTGFRQTPVTEEQLAELAEPTLKLLAEIGPEW